jgi:hypothetical protein
MFRIVVEILLPLLLPTVLYIAGTRLAELTQRGGAVRRAPLPWLWLAGAGVVLLAAMLLVVTVGFGTVERGVYVPPRWIGGHIEPGHIEPGR